MDSGRSHKCNRQRGSALVLVVMLVSLLAVVGMMFFMTARVNNMGASAVSENKELGFAIEAVIARISEQLIADVPDSNTDAEYYDYPGPNDPWLAALEPYTPDSNNYYWRQISDIYGRLDANNLQAIIIPDYQRPSDVGDSNSALGYPADADGDGVADSEWIRVNDITSNKGEPVYAAIRIVDNGGMINVNTIFASEPNVGDKRKGDMLTDIYIDGLKKSPSDSITEFIDNRSNAPDAATYYLEAARRIENPDTTTNYYTFYDIGEELSLRNRYVLVPGQTRPTQPWLSSMTRLESYEPPSCLYYTLRLGTYGNAFRPYSEWPNWSDALASWKRRLNPFDEDKEPNSNNYDFRHLLTTYNMDRIINPIGSGFNDGKMVNVNRDEVGKLYSAIYAGLYEANFAGNPFETAAQMAVNLVDFRDNDSNVTVYLNTDNSKYYYGFESPCIYISELAHNFTVSGDPPVAYRSYAVELYKPYSEDNDPCNWQLEIGGTPITIDNWMGNKQFYVIQDQDSNAPLEVDSGAVIRDKTFAFTANTEISLQRPLPVGGYVTVDWYKVDPSIPAPWLSEDGSPHSIQRDISKHKCIRRLWASVARNDDDDLGKGNTFVDSDSNVVQAHPANTAFTNVGEIGMLFREDVYSDIVRGAVESDVRLNLADPNFQQLFRYLTVFDPNSDTIDNDGDGLIDAFDTNIREHKVAGRININTAPWYVIAQLPWMQYQDGTPFERAKAISDYRDNMLHCFGSIGELMQVPEMQSLAYDGADNLHEDDPNGPDFTNDTARDDFEERDVIFSRISNLATVRSDVFTAYILVRLGTDGPQKRVIAILDRSGVSSSGGRVKIVALHLVPDPR